MPPKRKAKQKVMEVSDEDDIDDFGQIIVKAGLSKTIPLVVDSDASISDSDSDSNTKESTIARVKRTRTQSNSVKTPQAKPKINSKQCVKRTVKNQKKK